MIRHVVLFKFLDEANGKSKAENVRMIFKLAEDLKNLPSVRSFEVVTNSTEAAASNYDLALIGDFDDMEGLNQYSNHPKHVEFVKAIHQVRESRACIDYEI